MDGPRPAAPRQIEPDEGRRVDAEILGEGNEDHAGDQPDGMAAGRVTHGSQQIAGEHRQKLQRRSERQRPEGDRRQRRESWR